MSLFDTILIPCPNCFQYHEAQTKAGECLMRSFKLNDDPLMTVAAVGEYICEHCGKTLEVKLESVPKAIVRITNV